MGSSRGIQPQHTSSMYTPYSQLDGGESMCRTMFVCTYVCNYHCERGIHDAHLLYRFGTSSPSVSGHAVGERPCGHYTAVQYVDIYAPAREWQRPRHSVGIGSPSRAHDGRQEEVIRWCYVYLLWN